MHSLEALYPILNAALCLAYETSIPDRDVNPAGTPDFLLLPLLILGIVSSWCDLLASRMLLGALWKAAKHDANPEQG